MIPIDKIDVAKKIAELKNRKRIENLAFYNAAKTDESFFIALMIHHKDLLVDAIEHSGITCDHFMWTEHAEFYLYLMIYYMRYGGAQLTDLSFRSIAEAHVPSLEVPRWIARYSTYDTQKVSSEDYPRLKEALISRCTQNKLYQLIRGGALLDDIFKTTKTDQHKVIQKLGDDINDIIMTSARTNEKRFSADFSSSLSNQVIADMEKAKTVELRDRDLLCGLSCIDDEFLGFARGKYAVILGFPNGGKTSVMLNFASNMARTGYKVGYVTVESTGKEVTKRLLARRSRIPSKKMKLVRGPEGMTDELWNRLYTAKEEFDRTEGCNLFTITVEQGMMVDDILALVDKYAAVMGGFDAVYFDYLEVFGINPKKMSNVRDRRDLELAWISQQIQAWGKKHNVFVCSAQSIPSEKIKEFRKKEFLDKGEKSSIFVGVENVGGSQALTRDPDYVFSVVQHPRNGLIIYATKARLDAPAGLRWVVGWDRDICDIYDMESSLFEMHSVKATMPDVTHVLMDEKCMVASSLRRPGVSSLATSYLSSFFALGGEESVNKKLSVSFLPVESASLSVEK